MDATNKNGIEYNQALTSLGAIPLNGGGTFRSSTLMFSAPRALDTTY